MRVKAEVEVLVRLGREEELFHDADEIGHVRLVATDRLVVAPVWSRTFEDHLRGQFQALTSGTARVRCLRQALRTLELTALYDRPQIDPQTLSGECVTVRLKSEPFPPRDVASNPLLMAQRRERQLLKAARATDADC
jgi:hypothetical protein